MPLHCKIWLFISVNWTIYKLGNSQVDATDIVGNTEIVRSVVQMLFVDVVKDAVEDAVKDAVEDASQSTRNDNDRLNTCCLTITLLVRLKRKRVSSPSLPYTLDFPTTLHAPQWVSFRA
jgi:hypothetical protein